VSEQFPGVIMAWSQTILIKFSKLRIATKPGVKIRQITNSATPVDIPDCLSPCLWRFVTIWRVREIGSRIGPAVDLIRPIPNSLPGNQPDNPNFNASCPNPRLPTCLIGSGGIAPSLAHREP
jgi:hypothetical protein